MKKLNTLLSSARRRWEDGIDSAKEWLERHKLSPFASKRLAVTFLLLGVLTEGALLGFAGTLFWALVSKFLFAILMAWALCRFAIRYYLPGSFKCKHCGHLKCKKHTGAVLEDGVVCGTCQFKRILTEQELKRVQDARDEQIRKRNQESFDRLSKSINGLCEGIRLRLGEPYPTAMPPHAPAEAAGGTDNDEDDAPKRRSA